MAAICLSRTRAWSRDTPRLCFGWECSLLQHQGISTSQIRVWCYQQHLCLVRTYLTVDQHLQFKKIADSRTGRQDFCRDSNHEKEHWTRWTLESFLFMTASYSMTSSLITFLKGEQAEPTICSVPNPLIALWCGKCSRYAEFLNHNVNGFGPLKNIKILCIISRCTKLVGIRIVHTHS